MQWIIGSKQKLINLSHFSMIATCESQDQKLPFAVYGYFPNGDYELIWECQTKMEAEQVIKRLAMILKSTGSHDFLSVAKNL